MDRRSFLTGFGASLIAAPAIVRASSLMPVRGIILPIDFKSIWARELHYLLIDQRMFADLIASGAHLTDDGVLLTSQVGLIHCHA